MPPISRPRCFAALLVAAMLPASAGAADPDPCAPFRNLAIPAGDQPTAADRGRLAGCESARLYRVDAEAASLRDARLCAFLERASDAPPAYGGPGVLMMIYANGLGVKRDYGLARRFACEIDGAPAELEGRLDHLAQLAAGGGEPIELCDDITSGYMMGVCAAQGATEEAAVRDQKLAALQARWTPARREAFPPLRRAATTFFEARVQNEVDQSGTARAALMIAEEDTLEQTFLDHLLAFEKGDLPKGDAATLKAADTELNAVYGRLMKAAPPESKTDDFTAFGTLRREGIRAAQRAWLPYRDAWATFGVASYPQQVPKEAWLTWQTRLRIQMLEELAVLGE